jgi:hypothetical protein
LQEAISAAATENHQATVGNLAFIHAWRRDLIEQLRYE